MCRLGLEADRARGSCSIVVCMCFGREVSANLTIWKLIRICVCVYICLVWFLICEVYDEMWFRKSWFDIWKCFGNKCVWIEFWFMMKFWIVFGQWNFWDKVLFYELWFGLYLKCFMMEILLEELWFEFEVLRMLIVLIDLWIMKILSYWEWWFDFEWRDLWLIFWEMLILWKWPDRWCDVALGI